MWFVKKLNSAMPQRIGSPLPHSIPSLFPKDILRKIEVVAGDVTDPFYVDSIIQGADTVYHLAALIAIPFSYVAPELYVSTNVAGTLNVLQACRRHKVKRLIHTSTSEVYGDPGVHPQPEGYWGHVNPIGIRSCYDEGTL